MGSRQHSKVIASLPTAVCLLPTASCSLAQVGVEPTASLVLSESGRPVAYRAFRLVAEFARIRACRNSGEFRYSHCQRATPGVGVEPTSAGSKPASLTISRPRKTVGSRQSAVGSRQSAVEARRVPTGACRLLTANCLLAPAEGEGVEPSRLIARWFSGPLPSPVGLPFRFSAVCLLPSAFCLLPSDQSGWLDSNQRSPAPEAGGFNQALPHPDQMGLQGLEP